MENSIGCPRDGRENPSGHFLDGKKPLYGHFKVFDDEWFFGAVMTPIGGWVRDRPPPWSRPTNRRLSARYSRPPHETPRPSYTDRPRSRLGPLFLGRSPGGCRAARCPAWAGFCPAWHRWSARPGCRSFGRLLLDDSRSRSRPIPRFLMLALDLNLGDCGSPSGHRESIWIFPEVISAAHDRGRRRRS